MTEGTVQMRMRALLVAAPLALAVLGPAVPADAQSAAKPTITPGNGQVVTSSTVTISVKSGFVGGKLVVDGVLRDQGANKNLTWSFNGHNRRNGPVKVMLQDPVPFNSVESTFVLAVPPSAPSGVQAKVSGNKITVSWNRGGEPDLTGYSVTTSLGGGKSVGVGSCGGRCTTTLSVGAAGGQLGIQVVAKRRGAEPSGATSRTVRLAGTAPPSSGNNNNPVPPPGNNWSAPSNNGNNPNPFPNVNPPPGDPFSTVSPAPEASAPELSPDDGSDIDTSLLPQPVADSRMSTTEESLQWGKSIAMALVLLLCAGHLGTWTRRLRAARSGGGVALGPRVIHGSAHARVEANRLHIEAALAAARGATESDGPQPKRRFLSRKRPAAAPGAPTDVAPDADDALTPAPTPYPSSAYAPDESAEKLDLGSSSDEDAAPTRSLPEIDAQGTDDAAVHATVHEALPDDADTQDTAHLATVPAAADALAEPDSGRKSLNGKADPGTPPKDSSSAPAPRDPSADVDALASLATPARHNGQSALHSAYASTTTQAADADEPDEPWYEGMPDAPYTWSPEPPLTTEQAPTQADPDAAPQPDLGPAELLDTPRPRRFLRRRS
ncbi:hypothetical protein GCM10027589_21890 [Actinocorallia lasiicapitis]